MKKMFAAFAAILAAAGLQAATYNWSVMSSSAAFNGWESTAGVGKVWSGATATAGLQYYFIATSLTSQSDLLTGLRSGKKMDDYASSILAFGTTTASGIAKNAFTADSSLVGTDGKMSAYMAIFSTDDSSVFLGSSATALADLSGGQTDYSISLAGTKILRDADGETAYGSQGWYAVPEPTSGVLMLVGMGVLALRRKRA